MWSARPGFKSSDVALSPELFSVAGAYFSALARAYANADAANAGDGDAADAEPGIGRSPYWGWIDGMVARAARTVK